MFPKRLLALTLFAALTVMPPCVLRAQWVQTNLYIDQQVHCFASEDSVPFAGTSCGGIFKSLDQGNHWISSNNGLPSNTIIMALAVSGSAIVASTQDSSLYRSTDGGLNWYPVRSGLLNAYSSYPYTYGFFSDSTFLFAATADGIYRSSDNGTSWFQQDAGIEFPQYANFQTFCKNSSFLFAGGLDCFVRSSDYGMSWVIADSGLTQAGYVYSLLVLGNSIFAGTSHGIYLSTNNGDYWAAENSSIPANPRVNCFAITDSGGTAVMFAGTNDGVYISTDSGTTWVERDAGLPLDHRIGSFSMVGNMLLIGTAVNGVFASTDLGLTWDTSNTGLPIISPSILTLLATQSSIYAGGGGIFRSTDDGAHWNSVGAQVSLETYALALCGQNLLAGTEGGISLSTNSGASWKSVYTQPISSFAVSGNYVFAGGYGGACYSSDSGEHWTPITFNLQISLDGGGVSVAANDSFLFAGTGDVFSDGAMIRSSDSGNTWSFDETGVASWYDITDIAVEESDSSLSNDLFACYGGNSVIRSTNNGGSWEILDTIVNVSGKAYIDAVASDDFMVFAGVSGSNDPHGVLLSTDNGASWKWDNSGLPANPQFQYFAFKDTTVFAGSYTGGVWKRFGVQPINLPYELVEASHSTEINLQVFPNPFSQSTQITFTPQAAGYAEVSIVNMLGVEVARLFSGELGEGEHSFLWGNPTDFPDGVYECLVRMNGQVQTLPVVLMRN